MHSNIFLQIVIFQKLKKLYSRNIRDSRFVKYIKQYFLKIYDEFYIRREFSNQKIDWYLERIVSWIMQYRKTSKINVNEDSNMIFTNYESNKNNENEQRNQDFVSFDENDLIIHTNWSIWQFSFHFCFVLKYSRIRNLKILITWKYLFHAFNYLNFLLYDFEFENSLQMHVFNWRNLLTQCRFAFKIIW